MEKMERDRGFRTPRRQLGKWAMFFCSDMKAHGVENANKRGPFWLAF
jgi:hypothetical protein